MVKFIIVNRLTNSILRQEDGNAEFSEKIFAEQMLRKFPFKVQQGFRIEQVYHSEKKHSSSAAIDKIVEDLKKLD